MNRNPTTAFCVAIAAFITLCLTLYAISPVDSSQYTYGEESTYESKQDSQKLGGTLRAKLPLSDVVATDSSLDESSVFEAEVRDALNTTLGFQEVFVITLPSRPDRLDAFTVQAGLSDIKFNSFDGVVGKEVLTKSLPLGYDRERLTEGQVGCWRAHLNIYQTMVEKGIQSALIFEDDADWDINIKYQMLDVARGTRWLLNSTDSDTSSPYGDEWDLIWIGHSSSLSFEEPREPHRWVTPNDPTVIPPGARHEFEKPNMTYWDKDKVRGDMYTRILYRPAWGSVTTAYAISLRGAMKMIYHQSMRPFNDYIDNGMGAMCREFEKYSNFTCVAPFPRIVASAVVPGTADKLTDIEGHAGDHPELWTNTEAASHHLQYSTKMNIDGLFRGDTTFRARYGGEAGPEEMSLADMRNIRGHAEVMVPDGSGKWYPKVV